MPDKDAGSAITGSVGWPERAAIVRRATARLCQLLGWAALHEVPLPNGRRADLLALRPDGGFVCIEVKSGARDFLVDSKWREYHDWCDALAFAVDEDFPRELIPDDAGLIVVCDRVAELSRAPVGVSLPPARRRALLLRFAHLGAWRLAAADDPEGAAEARAALRAE